MKMVFVLGIVFMWWLAFKYWRLTDKDAPFIIMQIYSAALFVIGYLEFR